MNKYNLPSFRIFPFPTCWLYMAIPAMPHVFIATLMFRFRSITRPHLKSSTNCKACSQRPALPQAFTAAVPGSMAIKDTRSGGNVAGRFTTSLPITFHLFWAIVTADKYLFLTLQSLRKSWILNQAESAFFQIHFNPQFHQSPWHPHWNHHLLMLQPPA